MANNKKSTDLLAARMAAVTIGSKPAVTLTPTANTPKPVKFGRTKRSDRKDSFKQGLLVLGNGERLDCVIKNVSETGARVDFFRGGSGIAGRVKLLDQSTGTQRWAQVVWKDQNSAGLKFEG
jgi:hypothetical protein